jgi:5'-3' exonuclease
LATAALIDGTYELFRAHYGAPRASVSGRELGAVRGLLRSLNALMRDGSVTHVACAFDSVIESFRNELFTGYKTGIGLDPDLLSQFSLAERASEALGIVTWRMIEFEADDALATAARALAADPRIEKVIICSPDKDLAQCVQAERVVCRDRARDKWLDEAGVRDKFGVSPGCIPDLLALVGDTADGIPGVPRWGMLSAATLLARYGALERIPLDHSSWDVQVRGAAALAQSLRLHQAEAALYKRLATLRLDVPVDAALEVLEWRGAQREALERLCAEIGDATVLSRVARWAC